MTLSLINRLVGVVDDPADTGRIGARLQALGIDEDDIDVLLGSVGTVRLDSTGGTSWWRRVVRVTQFMTVDQSTEYQMLDAALRDGRAVMAVLIRDRPLKEPAVEVLRAEGAHLISFFGRILTEEITRWRGPELVRPAVLPGRVDPSA